MELSTPITVYWDLPSCPSDIEYLKRVSRDIIALRPLMLQLSTADFQQEGFFPLLAEAFNATQIHVSITMPVVSLACWEWSLFADFKLKEVLFSSESFSEIQRFETQLDGLSGHAPVGTVPGLSFAVTRESWQNLPSVVEFCRTSGLKRLVLPMQRLYNNEAPISISREEQMDLQYALAAAGGTQGIDLTIHDPFLWKAFNPGVPFPQGGCQAANTMIAISGDGAVYPCPSLPVKLGTIGDMTLKEIVASSVKRGFRRKLLEKPSDCCECSEFGECRGGCRGRAYVQQGSLDGLDSACR
jgi:GeoRSP system SPASM domain protein